MIAKQSEELESHAERLYKSVLAAVDPGQGQDREQGDSTRQAAAQWVSRGAWRGERGKRRKRGT